VRRALILPLLLLAALAAHADTIVLKNGRRISATSVVEEGDRVYYETTAGRLSFPKSMVERIERGGYMDIGTSSSGSNEPPVEAPRLELGPDFDEVMKATIGRGAINRDYLTKLEEDSRSGRAEAVKRVAMGYHAAARFLYTRGEVDRALDQYRRGLIFAPEDLGLLTGIAQIHLRHTEYTEALSYLERARRTAPDSADVAKLTGWAYHGQNKMEQAIKEWKRAYALRPDFDVLLAIQKTERDAKEESAYKEGESMHFLLRYHGEAAPQLAGEVLRTLEGHFRALETELNFTPPEGIGVVLYTEEAYFDITGSPAWVGAINDGRIRVPVQGLSSMTPPLSRTLKHELVHSFLAQKTRDRCPTWLHEGLAQWFEGKRADPELAAWLIVNVVNNRIPSLALMDGSWMGLQPATARSFYISSLLVVEYLVQRFGMGDVERLLSRLPNEPTSEAAIKGVYRMDYRELESETVEYLYRTYIRK
jgi:tetratricopeptide (TPR) repeat protein